MAIQWTAVPLEKTPEAGKFVPMWQRVLTATDWKLLCFEATGEWTFQVGSEKFSCTPDGAPTASLPPSSLVIDSCPPGCLLGRFGGSSADTRGGTGDAAPFAIGSDRLHVVPPNVYGPLFIGFNLLWRPIDISKITLTVTGANPG